MMMNANSGSMVKRETVCCQCGGCFVTTAPVPYEDHRPDGDVCAECMERAPTGEALYLRLQRVVAEKQAVTFRWDLDGTEIVNVVDMQSANMVCTVADGLNPANRAKFLAMRLGPMVILGWKVLSR